MARLFKSLIQADGGIKIPAGAGAGLVWVSDANGLGSWTTVGSAGITDASIAASDMAAGAALANLAANSVTVGKLAVVPCCRVYNSADFAIGNGTLTPVSFDSERFDTDTMHSTSTNKTRITFTTAGVYIVGANMQFDNATVGSEIVDIFLNNTTSIQRITYRNGGSAMRHETVTIYSFAANDYIEIRCYQDGSAGGGAGANVKASANYSPEAWAARLSA